MWPGNLPYYNLKITLYPHICMILFVMFSPLRHQLFLSIPLLVLVTALLFPSFLSAQKRPLNVTFISVATEDEAFWSNMTGMAQAAARDLSINFEVLYSNRDHFKAVELVNEVANRTKKPDYVIVVAEKNIASQSIVITDRAEIKTLLFGSLTEQEKKTIGSPRKKYPHWIGQREIDDFSAGYLVAKSVLDSAIAAGLRHTDGKLYTFGLAGVFNTAFNEERIKGLRKALSEYPDTILLQLFPAYWQKATAAKITRGSFRRYQKRMGLKIGAIWSANSDMALGAIKGSKDAGMVPGKDIFISGIDYTEPSMQKIQSGELQSVVGGHFAEIAWLLVMIYDYHNGKDFLGENSKTTLFTLTRSNVNILKDYFAEKKWDTIDFTSFSRVIHPEINHYTFGCDSLLRQLQ